MTTRPVLANAGAMNQFIGAFEVTSKLSGQEFHCRFSHMWNGIATRHADTIDTKFFVGSEALVVGLAHHRLRQVSRTHRTRPYGPRIELHRRRVLTRAPGGRRRAPLYDVSESEVLRLIEQLGIRLNAFVAGSRSPRVTLPGAHANPLIPNPPTRHEIFPAMDAAIRPAG